jgi:hypothetical protein
MYSVKSVKSLSLSSFADIAPAIRVSQPLFRTWDNSLSPQNLLFPTLASRIASRAATGIFAIGSVISPFCNDMGTAPFFGLEGVVSSFFFLKFVLSHNHNITERAGI